MKQGGGEVCFHSCGCEASSATISISVPAFVNDGGPLGDADARHLLAEFAVAEAQRSGASLVELRSRDDLSAPVSASNRKISVHLVLPASDEELWQKTFRAKLRSQIRRPIKEGMTARTGLEELEKLLSGILEEHARPLTPVLPRKFFDAHRSYFRQSMFTSRPCTRKRVTLLPLQCCLLWRSEMEVTWASSVRELNHLAPDMLLYSHLMQNAIAAGGTVFNFGRCSPDSPIALIF